MLDHDLDKTQNTNKLSTATTKQQRCTFSANNLNNNKNGKRRNDTVVFLE